MRKKKREKIKRIVRKRKNVKEREKIKLDESKKGEKKVGRKRMKIQARQ